MQNERLDRYNYIRDNQEAGASGCTSAKPHRSNETSHDQIARRNDLGAGRHGPVLAQDRAWTDMDKA